MNAELELRNRQLMGKLLVICAAMLGFAYLMVPMYRQICRATGIDRTRVVGLRNSQVDMSREIKVEFMASTAGGLPWRFEPLDPSVTLHPGEYKMVRYRVVNTLGRTITAHASWSTAPARAALWIQKKQCFCFTNQTLKAGETRDMPVVFRVSPDAPKDLGLITLSYTFFEAPKAAS
ncbi:MAG TPA: cytochrome c oxidase assembly protein [Usitatibacter sp.]|nr:cytochrome c oxidase assembly protein [Usitatibacter sp.]